MEAELPHILLASGHWYPGDEWKGDVARMMMYMYLRYGSSNTYLSM